MAKQLLQPGIGLFFLATAVAQAQTTPDAGKLMETMKPEPARSATPATSIVIPLPTVPATSDDQGPTITVQRFIIEGAKLFPPESLENLLSDLRGKPVTLGQIRQGAERITKQYQDAGYFVARAYLIPQAVGNGEVRISIQEGRFGEVKIAGLSTDKAPQLNQRSRNLLEAQGIAAQNPIARQPLERGVLLLEDLVGAEVKATLRPGASIGTGDLNLETKGKPPVSGYIGTDSYGFRYSGSWRLNGGLNLQNPLTAGDTLAFRATHSEGLDFLLAAYQFPVGLDGLKLSFNLSSLQYKLCCGAPPTGSKGSADNVNLGASYPLLLTQSHNLTLTGALEHKTLKDDTSVGNLNDKRVDILSLGVSGLVSDTRFSQRAEATLALGHLDLGRNASALSADSASARSNGSYSKLRLGYTARWNINPTDVLQLRLSGQWAGENLDSSEKMSFGGIDGVRAYPTGEASGDEGLMARLEWAAPLKQEAMTGQLGLTTFLDAANLKINAKPWSNFAATRNEYSLAGAGLGLTWTSATGLSAAAVLATPLGENPGRINGRDSDGRSPGSRLWLMLNLPL